MNTAQALVVALPRRVDLQERRAARSFRLSTSNRRSMNLTLTSCASDGSVAYVRSRAAGRLGAQHLFENVDSS